MIPIIFLAAPAPVQTVTVTHPAPVVIYQAAPRPVFPVFRPAFVVQSCPGGNCPK